MKANPQEVLEMIIDMACKQQEQGVPRGAFKTPGFHYKGGPTYVVFSDGGPDRATMDRQLEVVRGSLKGLGLIELGIIPSTQFSPIALGGLGRAPEFGWIMIVQPKKPSPTRRNKANSQDVGPLVTQLNALVRQAWDAVMGSQGACAA